MSSNIDEIVEVIDTEKECQIYEDKITFYWHEYFENRHIDLDGLEFTKIPNTVYRAAFRYINKQLFLLREDDYKRYNQKTSVDLRNIELLEYITDRYIDLVTEYNVKPFIYYYCDFLGINIDTFNSWYNGEYNHFGLSIRYSAMAEKIHKLSGEQIKSDLAGEKMGRMMLANYDSEVNLNYAESKAKLSAQGTIQALKGADLPQLGDLTE